MFVVYVLKSLKNGKRYVGYTSKVAVSRLAEHNSGSSKWTRANKPFILVYEETHQDKTRAKQREGFLKSGQGRKFLDTMI